MGASGFYLGAYAELGAELVCLEDLRGAWALFDQAGAFGLTPDRIRCTELGRTVRKETRAEHGDRASSLVG